jgi:hypothetical protein
VVAALVGCSSGSQKNPTDGGGTAGRNGTVGAGGGQPSATGGNSGLGGAPSAATDTNPANPHVTNMPPSSPNGPTVTVSLGSGGVTGGGPARGTGGAVGNATGGVSGSATGGATGGVTGGATGGLSGGATGGLSGGATGGVSGGATGGVTGTGGAVTGAGGAPTGGADAGAPATGTNGGIPATWATVDCVGGPCGPPGVCVNLDFLFVACAICGGEDEVCCPPYAASDPWLGTCGAGMICAHNPNFQDNPPLDLVQDVCQIPGSPPPADGGLNHERETLGP